MDNKNEILPIKDGELWKEYFRLKKLVESGKGTAAEYMAIAIVHPMAKAQSSDTG